VVAKSIELFFCSGYGMACSDYSEKHGSHRIKFEVHLVRVLPGESWFGLIRRYRGQFNPNSLLYSSVGSIISLEGREVV